jgi:hypothetical protein
MKLKKLNLRRNSSFSINSFLSGLMAVTIVSFAHKTSLVEAQNRTTPTISFNGIKNGDTLNGTVFISANVSRTPQNVQFFIDGQRVWTENFAPYFLGGDVNSKALGFNMSRLSQGQHKLRVAAKVDNSSINSTEITFNTGNTPPQPQPTQISTKPVGDTPPVNNNSNTLPKGNVQGKPIPNLAKWEANMTRWGATHCATYTSSSANADQKLAGTYYDGAYIYYQIADYTKDNKWLTCARQANSIYKDQFVFPSNGVVPGYWNFTTGLVQTFLRFGDESSKQAALLIKANAPYARDWTKDAETLPGEIARENAYAINSYIDVTDIGSALHPRVHMLVDHAIGHIDRWFISRTAGYVRPFMVALESNSMIKYYERVNKDQKIVNALKQSMDFLWDRTYLPNEGSFMYNDRPMANSDMGPSPDLNLIAAPVFAWLYCKTGEQKYLDRGDSLFNVGVEKSFLVMHKIYNQNYRFSFDYVRLRRQCS